MVHPTDRPEPFAIARRPFLAGAAALATGLLAAGRTLAAPPHRFGCGGFQIDVFSDGFITLPDEVIAPDASPAERADIIRRLGGRQGAADIPVNIPLIRAGEALILVDTGSGNTFQPSAGRLWDNLLAAGVDPAAITHVVLTHAHPDHAGGVLRPGGTLSFPNATHHVAAAEWDFWMGREPPAHHPGLRGLVPGARRDLGALAERLVRMRDGDELVSGLRVLATPGHTPGHISLELMGGDGLLITGDAITNVVASFEHPGWRFGFDTDQDQGIATRTRLIERAAAEKLRMLGYHWTSPGLAVAERHGAAYRHVALT
ncbi:glyoxylase-like metal-dependent hydrolase (beta-lactamase superfamily II) [Azospirillum sp. OGB3]|uniref:MBL fold metallo-hydrolase n=1 Tax=Azospirillum sp. OGB3 TaxID=2587012 RepID=UPI001606B69D|nr:MBL fold metallo-hydrolase [Azospirillum sp. OGB3]MBB3268699.1 glyoxylase-like metal-dependent hydrolase (beta-lactamase superfamily II) [Azospirillum sp. OGB3]